MTAKSEAELLMNDLLPFAERMLAQFGEFHPFGGKMLSDGSIVQVGADTGQEHPPGSRLVELMKAGFAAEGAAGAIRCAAIVANVRVAQPGGKEKVDAIEVLLDHVEGYSVEIFFPYVIEEGAVETRPPFAQGGSRFAFGGPTSVN